MELFEKSYDYLKGLALVKSRCKVSGKSLVNYVEERGKNNLNDILSLYSDFIIDKRCYVKRDIKEIDGNLNYSVGYKIDYDKYINSIRNILNNFDINYILNNINKIKKELNNIIEVNENSIEKIAIESYASNCYENNDDIVNEFGSLSCYYKNVIKKYNNNELESLNKNIIKEISIEIKEKVIDKYINNIRKRAKYLAGFDSYRAFKAHYDELVNNGLYKEAIDEIKKGIFDENCGKLMLNYMGYNNIEFMVIDEDIINKFNMIDKKIIDEDSFIDFVIRNCGNDRLIEYYNIIELIRNGNYYLDNFKIKDNKDLLKNYIDFVNIEIKNGNIAV